MSFVLYWGGTALLFISVIGLFAIMVSLTLGRTLDGKPVDWRRQAELAVYCLLVWGLGMAMVSWSGGP